MRILYLPAYYWPERAASGYLNENRSEAFVKAGFYTVVYTARPQRGLSEEEYYEYKQKKFEMMYDNGVEVHRFAMYREGKNAFLRAFRYLLISGIQFWKGIWSKNIDLIYVASTPPTQGALAALIKKFKRVPFIYNLQDIFPDSLTGTGLAKKGGFLWKVGRLIENFTYRNADKIIVIGEDFKKNIINKGVPAEKIEVVYNWIDESVVVPVKKEDNPLFKEFEINQSKFNVVYAGNLGNAQNIDVIIDSAKVLSDTHNINFLIFGTGGLKDRYIAKVKKEGLNNVRFFPLQPIERVSYVYGLGDVCIVSCKPGLGGAAMPSKTWTIMACGRPVIASFDEGELKEIIEKNNCGVFSHAGNVKEFVAAIKLLAANREKCEDMGKNGRQFILDNLTREVGTKKIVDIIKSVVKK